MKHLLFFSLLGLLFCLSFGRLYNGFVGEMFNNKYSFIKLEKSKLAYRYYNSKKAKTVLIIPGLGASLFEMEELSQELSKHVNVLIFDRYSYGLSTQKTDLYNYDLVTKTILSIMKELSISQKVDILGLSLGAAYGSYFYSQHPDKVASFTNVDCSMPEEVTEDKEYKDKILNSWLRELKRKQMTSVLGIAQIKAIFSYLLRGSSRENLITALPGHINATVMEGDFFWDILEQANFYQDYSELPLLVISSTSREQADFDKSKPLSYHRKLSKLSRNGEHLILTSSDHLDLFDSKRQLLLASYLKFIESYE